MIPNCPGRYTIRNSKRAPVEINGTSVTSMDTLAFINVALNCSQGEEHGRVVVHRLESGRCKDPVHVAVFATGGGVITYCKIQGEGNAELFVHTLNTASGLERKLRGLQLEHVLETL